MTDQQPSTTQPEAMDDYISIEVAGETYVLLVPSISQQYGPRIISDVSELNPPAGFNYVMWRWATGTPLQDVFKQLKANDVLVLPEDETPYLIDTTKGFRQGDGIHDIAMARCKAGIIGLGPNAVIDLAPSSFSAPRQTGSEGNRNKVLECWTAGAIIANFTMKGRDLGGVAYDAIKGAADDIRMENLYLKGAHRGWLAYPPGEAGGLVNYRANRMVIRNCEVDCRDEEGRSVGTSPVMLNKSNDCLIEDSYFHHANTGMPTAWSCNNLTTRNIRSEYNSTGFNHELVTGIVVHENATFIIDRAGRTENRGAHISIGTNLSSAVYNIDMAEYDAGYEGAPEKFFVQLMTASYTPWGQKDSDIHVTKNGQAVPVLIGR